MAAGGLGLKGTGLPELARAGDGDAFGQEGRFLPPGGSMRGETALNSQS